MFHALMEHIPLRVMMKYTPQSMQHGNNIPQLIIQIFTLCVASIDNKNDDSNDDGLIFQIKL